LPSPQNGNGAKKRSHSAEFDFGHPSDAQVQGSGGGRIGKPPKPLEDRCTLGRKMPRSKEVPYGSYSTGDNHRSRLRKDGTNGSLKRNRRKKSKTETNGIISVPECPALRWT